jgi:hypothetical protein
MRSSGVWAYGVVNLFHILGIASFFGSVLILDLRLLGYWQSVALPAISRPTVPIAASGFILAVTSGACLIATNATEYAGNPFIYIKFPAIGLGLLNVAVLNFLPAWRQHRVRDLSSHERKQLSIVAWISLFSWLTAISAGRMIGYW